MNNPMAVEFNVFGSDWRWVTLGEVCEIQLGKMLSQESRRGAHPKPYLRNANVQWTRFDLHDVAKMDFDAVEQKKFALRTGDLLVCEGGEPGRAAVWEAEMAECYYQKALHRLRPIRDAVDPYFILYRLWLSGLTGEFADQHSKATIAHLPAVRLAQLRIAIPSPVEQRRIAARLKEQMAEVECARAAAEAQNENLNSFVLAAIRQTFAAPGVVMQPVGEVLNETKRGVGQSWANFPVYGATRAGLALAKEPVGKTPWRYKPVTPGTIFYNPMRILLGSIAMLAEDKAPGVTSPDYVVMEAISGVMEPLWFYEWLRSVDGAQFILGLARGAVRERMLFNRLAQGHIPVPPLAAQLQFCRIAREARAAQRCVAQQLKALAALPAAYLREAFTGVS